MPTERPALADILEPLNSSLSRLAAEQRRAAAEYSNLAARSGSGGPPRRYLSDAGFLVNLQFSYLDFSPSSATYDDTGAQRPLNRLRFVGYGAEEDLTEFITPEPLNQLIHSATSERGPGLREYGPGRDYLIARNSNAADTYDPSKIRTFCRTQDNRPVAVVNGPHFLITREGAIIVVGSADATAAFPAARDANNNDVLFVGVETTLAIDRLALGERDWNQAFELPFTPAQLVTMAVLIQKLKTAMPALANASFSDDVTTPLSYTLLGVPNDFQAAARKNLQAAVPNIDRSTGNSPFDYSGSTGPSVLALAAQQGSYDISRNVWRLDPEPPPTAQEETRTIISQVGTLGVRSPLMGVYAEAAGGSRARQMRDQTRPEVFYARRRFSYRTAEGTEQQEQTTQATAAVEEVLLKPVENYEPHVYDFVTGYWGDGRSF